MCRIKFLGWEISARRISSLYKFPPTNRSDWLNVKLKMTLSSAFA